MDGKEYLSKLTEPRKDIKKVEKEAREAVRKFIGTSGVFLRGNLFLAALAVFQSQGLESLNSRLRQWHINMKVSDILLKGVDFIDKSGIGNRDVKEALIQQYEKDLLPLFTEIRVYEFLNRGVGWDISEWADNSR